VQSTKESTLAANKNRIKHLGRHHTWTRQRYQWPLENPRHRLWPWLREQLVNLDKSKNEALAVSANSKKSIHPHPKTLSLPIAFHPHQELPPRACSNLQTAGLLGAGIKADEFNGILQKLWAYAVNRVGGL
jgi:hypothetical protein